MGEPGLDMGGLTKEWFQLLIRKIFEPDYGMFVYHSHSRYYDYYVVQKMAMKPDRIAVVRQDMAHLANVISVLRSTFCRLMPFL